MHSILLVRYRYLFQISIFFPALAYYYTEVFGFLSSFFISYFLDDFAGRIAAGGGRFNSNSEVNINTEVKSIPVTKKGVYFAFRDEGACISLLAIKVYYITCPEVTINFARFAATPTGKEITIIEQATGTCVSNAEIVPGSGTPSYLCKGDGKWTLATGGCKCKAGFQPDHEKQTCNGEDIFFLYIFLESLEFELKK